MKKQNKNTRTRDLNQPLLKTEVLVSTICTRLHNGDETASPECRDPRRGENVEAADEEKVVGGLYIQVRQIRPTMVSFFPCVTESTAEHYDIAVIVKSGPSINKFSIRDARTTTLL